MMKKMAYRLREICDIVAGGTPATRNDAFWNGEISWITPADLSQHHARYIFSGERNITDIGLKKSAAKLLPVNTVLLTTRAPIGYIAIAGKEISTNQGFKNLICKKELVDYQYLYYWLSVNIEAIKNFATGATFPELSGTTLGRIKICVPDLSTQTKIADILSAYDDAIENNNRRIKILEQMAENLYKEWFVRMRFPGHETAEYENGLPKGWKYAKLDKVFTVCYGKDHSKIGDGTIPVYGSGGIMRYCDKNLYDGESVLIPRKGSLNNILWVNEPFWTVDTMFYTKALISNIEKYVYYVLSSLDMESFNTGAALPSMTTDILYHLKVMIPDAPLLKRFDLEVTSLFAQCALLKEQNWNLTRQRDLLLPRLMSGKMEVLA